MRRVVGALSVVVALGLLSGGCDVSDEPGPVPSGDEGAASAEAAEGPVDEPLDEPMDQPFDEPVDQPFDEPEGQATCQELVGEALDPADFRGFCDHGDVHITDATEWAGFVASCMTYNQDTLPQIDFATQAVVGAIVEVACPFQDGYHVDPPVVCDGTVEVRASIDRDFCYCDYFFDVVHLFVVEAAGVGGVVYDEAEATTCEERQCQCGDDEVKEACDVFEGWGACANIW